MWLSGHYTELRLRGPHEIEMATCDWEGHMWLRGHHVIERAPYDWEGTMWFSGYHITYGIIWVLLLEYIGHHGLPGTCVHVGLTVGVDVNSSWPHYQHAAQTTCQCYSPVRHRMAGHSARWSLFTLAIVLVYFSNHAFNNGLMNLYLCFDVCDLHIININI